MKKLVTEKKIVNIDHITGNPWNPNKQSDFIYEKMRATIAEKGLFGSIIVRPFAGMYQILDGEHRWKACKELGYTELPVECTIDEISDKDTQMWTLYFNNTKGKDDIEKVAKIFESLDEGQLQLLPYTSDTIENTKQLFKFDFAQYESKNEDTGESLQILTLKFTKDEWEIVKEAKQIMKDEKSFPKELFLMFLRKYVGLGGFKNSSYQLFESEKQEVISKLQ